jgi:hypothetical protein
MLDLIKLMLKEEFRFRTTYSNKYNFLGFPILIMIFTFILAYLSPQLLKEISLEQILLMLHSTIFLYGFSMGAFAFLGREYIDQTFGHIKFIVSSPEVLPLSFRKTIMAFYLHEIIFYIFIAILPIMFGLMLSIPFTGFSILGILTLIFAATLSFLLGISFSFFMATIFLKNEKVFVAAFAATGVVIIGAFFFNWFEFGLIFPSLKFQYGKSLEYLTLAILYVLLFTAGATYTVGKRFLLKTPKFKSELQLNEERYNLFQDYSIFLAKEFLDIKRSRTMIKILFTFLSSLIFIIFVSWLIELSLGIAQSFNIIFFGFLIGFFGVLIYSWLNITDRVEFYQTLPVTVPQLIKIKIMVFIIICAWICPVLIIILAFWNNELPMVGWALLVMFITSLYIVSSTAYLTGLRTNTYLFNTTILVKFGILSFLPFVCITILSFTLNTMIEISLFAILLICINLVGATFLLYRGIDRKWAKADFNV